MKEFNQAYIAHIIADMPGGPRGDKVLSPKLKDTLSNLMLLCDRHHRLIDKEDKEGHPANRLQEMKNKHEMRIETLSAIQNDKHSHVILYGSRIGEHDSPLKISEVSQAMVPERYPASMRPISLGIKNAVFTDDKPEYWSVQETQLVEMFRQTVTPIKATDETQHFSVFALAPMPLLIKLGTLLGDIGHCDVYQRHREPHQSWIWPHQQSSEDFRIIPPTDYNGVPVLNISLSATINNERISDVLADEHSVWTITIDKPQNDFLKSKELLSKFRQIMRLALNEIKAVHGQKSLLNVFPAMPVACAIEMGRVWMPKADISLQIYDQNKTANSFIKTLLIR